jgi:HlyD family secretion protein
MEKAPKKSRRNLWILLGILSLLIIAAVFKSRSQPKGEEIEVEKVAKRTIRETVTASGKIFPETEIKISSDVSGEIVELFVKEGDSVVAGQILARIKPEQYVSAVERGQASVSTARAQREGAVAGVSSSQANRLQLEASLKQAAAQLDISKKGFDRQEKLFKEGVISQAELDQTLSGLRAAEGSLSSLEANLRAADANIESARSNTKAAESGINSAEAGLRELKTNLNRTTIVAPASGIISKLNVEKGEHVLGTVQMSGTEILRIANLQAMEVQVEVSENDVLKLAVANEVDVEVDAYLGKKFKGRVTEIANSASNVSSALSGAAANLNNDQVTQFIVKVRIDPESYRDLLKKGMKYPFRPGMSAAVEIFTRSENDVLAVPIIAVTAREKDKDKDKKKDEGEAKTVAKSAENDKIQEIVFVMVGDTVAMREVKTGIQNNDYIQILSGVNEGEEVVSGPYSAISRKLEGGSRVMLKKADDKKSKD